MADIADGIDITTDLNGQAPDAVPVNQGDVSVEQRPVERGTPPADDAAPEKPKSLRDTLSDAFKGTEAPKVDQAPETPAEAKPEGPDLVKVGERFHRRDGSFASKDEIEAFNAPKGEAAPVSLPQWATGFTDLEKQQFTALPAEVRQFVERTMDGVNNRGAQYDEYQLLEQVLGPRRQAWAQQGMTPAVAVNQLFALSDFAGRDPGEFVMWFADQHKLNLDALLDARDAANNGGVPNPQITGLQQEIAELKNVINGFANTSVQQRHAQNMQLVQSFMDEKDAQGQLVHPYFNDLASDISSHVAMIRQQQPYLPERDILKAAYDFAAFNNPTVRNAVQQSQAKAIQDAKVAEAARARQVGVSINGGPAGDTSKQPNNANRTLREELRHAYNQSVQG